MPLIHQADEALDLARAICTDIAAYARSFVAAGTDLSPQVQEGRALFLSRVIPELALVFDEALSERAADLDLRALSQQALGTLAARAAGPVVLDDEEARRIGLELHRIPRADAAGVEAGALVKITGRVVARRPALSTPIARRPCVLYVLEAGEGVKDPPPESARPPWSRLPLEVRAADFAVDDGTATAVVQTRGARAALKFRDEDWRLEPAAARRDFLLSRGRRSPLPGEDGAGSRRFIHFRETTLGDGDRVTILGHAAREPAPDGGAASVPYRAFERRCVFRAGTSPLFIVQETRR